MSTTHELILEVSDLSVIAIKCSQCKTEFLLRVENKAKLPEKCGCGMQFDRLLREAIEECMSAMDLLRDRAQIITFRVRKTE